MILSIFTEKENILPGMLMSTSPEFCSWNVWLAKEILSIYWYFGGRVVQDGVVEDLLLIFSSRALKKLQLAVEQPLKGRRWIPSKQDTSHPRTKEKLQQNGSHGTGKETPLFEEHKQNVVHIKTQEK